MALALTASDRAILRYVARHSLEALDDHEGWATWTPALPWENLAWRRLVKQGLLVDAPGGKRGLTWLRLTQEGWRALATIPCDA
jgi:hypothetical protein